MKQTVTLVFVSSINGLLTDGEAQAAAWASTEDQAHFLQLKEQADALVMGSKTYQDAKEHIQLSPSLLRIVLTSKPEAYHDDHVSNQLEFKQFSADETLEYLRQKEKANILLVGGAQTAAHFFDQGMVDEVFLTIEPYYFSSGVPWVGGRAERLRLLSSKQLNENGTLLLRYKVQR